MRRFGLSSPTAELALFPLGVALGVAAELVSYSSVPLALRIADFVVGCTLFGCGAIAWNRRSESRVGPLLALSGLAWFLGNLASPLTYLNRGPLIHTVLSYPTGRARGRVLQTTIALAYLDALVEPFAANAFVTLAIGAVVTATAVYDFARSGGSARKAHATALAATLAFAGALTLGAVQQLVATSDGHVALWAYDVVVDGIAIGLLVDLLRGRWAEAVVTGLVVELGATGEVGLRTKLARALDDPSLVLAYRVRGTDLFVDDAGRPIELPPPGTARKTVTIEDRGEQVAVLLHDEQVSDDPNLVESVASAARMAVANARLEAEARAQALELEASRRRIVEAADAQRRRLGQELRRGTEWRLERFAALLADIREKATSNDDEFARLDSGLASARRELNEFAQGVHPAALTDGGLVAALTLLAERSPVPVELTGGLERVPAGVEAALFFVCAEALANATKHASAEHVTIDVRRERSRAIVAIADDGVGGADMSRGSGLRGLQDRVAAFGGRLAIESPRRRGTRLVVEIPIRP